MLKSEDQHQANSRPPEMNTLQTKSTIDLPEPSISPLSIKRSPLLAHRARTPSPNRSPSPAPAPSPATKSPTVSQKNKKPPTPAGLKLRSLVTVWRFVKRTYNKTRRPSPQPDKELRISVVGNLVKNCTDNFVGDEGGVKGSPEEGEEWRRRCSSDSGNSSWEDHYPYFIDKECREFIESAPNGRQITMSCDEADLSDHLDWINDLDVPGAVSTLSSPTPRYKKEAEYVNDLKIVSWWEFYSNESNLDEWDDEVQFYDEENDAFRKWANKHELDFETVSLLRSLHLDDTAALSRMNQTQLAALKSQGSIKNLAKALSSLTLNSSSNRVEFEEDIFSDDNLNIVDEKEFNLRPKLSRNLPHRRSTRTGKKASKNIHVRGDGIRTVGPGATRSRQGYNDSRRLSWEHFTFFNPNKPHSAPSSATLSDRHIGAARSSDKMASTPSPKSKHKIEHFKFPSDKKDKLTNKKSKALFPSITPI
ncbi:hypothetical protein ACHWQZ_G000510 [Mnemiopsis leidyi]